EQAADAAVKLLGVCYMGAKLLPGPPQECATRFASLPAGREMLLYFAAAEVALPFADNLVQGSGAVFGRLTGLATREGAARFGKVMGAEAAGMSGKILDAFRGPVEQHLDWARGSMGP